MKKYWTILISLFLISASWGYASETTKVNLKGNLKVKHFKLNIDNTRTVVLKDEVQAENIDAIVGQIKGFVQDSNKPIFIIINTPGGSIEAGLDLINLIKSISVPTYCVIETEAYSMGANISQYCTKTYIHKYAAMLFHRAAYSVRGYVDEVRVRVLFTDRYLMAIESDLARQMGLTHDQYLNKRGAEWWITADEAAKFGLVDGVIDELYYTAKPPEKKADIFTFGFDKSDIPYDNIVENPVK